MGSKRKCGDNAHHLYSNFCSTKSFLIKARLTSQLGHLVQLQVFRKYALPFGVHFGVVNVAETFEFIHIKSWVWPLVSGTHAPRRGHRTWCGRDKLREHTVQKCQ